MFTAFFKSRFQNVYAFTAFAFFVGVITSQSLMDALAMIMVFSLLWQALKKSGEPFVNYFKEHKAFCILSIMFFVQVALGFTLNEAWGAYALKRQYEALWPLVVLAILFFLQRFNSLRIGAYLWSLLAAVALPLVPFFYRILKDGAAFRYGGIFGDPMTFAHSFAQLAVVLICMGLFFTLNWNKKGFFSKSEKILVLVLSFLLALSILLSMTRGVWIGMCVSLLVGALYFSKRMFFLVLLLFITLFTLLFLFWPGFSERVLFTFQYEKTYDAERIALWRANWEMVKDYPVFGTGWGLNTQLLTSYYDKLAINNITFVSHAHNQLLHFWAGTGTLGLVIYLAFFFLMLKKTHELIAFYKDEARAFFIGLFVAQIEFLISGLTEANFERSRVRYILLFIWAIVLALHNRKKTSTSV